MAFKYTSQMDHDLMDEVIMYNPFKKGHSWESMRWTLDDHPTVSMCSSKSTRDWALLFMDHRKGVVKRQEKA